MGGTPPESEAGDREPRPSQNISFSGGTFSGPLSFGEHARATQTVHHPAGKQATAPADPAVAELAEALAGLREELARHQVAPEAAEVAGTALGDVETELGGALEGNAPNRGRVNTALLALAGALGGVAALSDAVQRLHQAVGAWLNTG